jgi:hypothetical protein
MIESMRAGIAGSRPPITRSLEAKVEADAPPAEAEPAPASLTDADAARVEFTLAQLHMQTDAARAPTARANALLTSTRR